MGDNGRKYNLPGLILVLYVTAVTGVRHTYEVICGAGRSDEREWLRQEWNSIIGSPNDELRV